MFGGSTEQSAEPVQEEQPVAEVAPEPEPEPEVAEINVVVPLVNDVDAKDSSIEVADKTEVVSTDNTEIDSVEYMLLPGDESALCTVNLLSGRIKVISSLVVAMDSTVSLEKEFLTGNGNIWIGQGALTPIPVRYNEGMIIRIDKLAVRPGHIKHESCSIDKVPSLRRLSGANTGNELLLFVYGRTKKIRITDGLKVKAGNLLCADSSIELKEVDNSEFLEVAGVGFIIVSG